MRSLIQQLTEEVDSLTSRLRALEEARGELLESAHEYRPGELTQEDDDGPEPDSPSTT